jgi:hypothetical protein
MKDGDCPEYASKNWLLKKDLAPENYLISCFKEYIRIRKEKIY